MNTKHMQLAVACLAITAFAVGCKPSEKASAIETPKSTGEQLDDVKQEAKEAAQAMNDYAYAQKTEFVATMQSQLDEIDRDVDELVARLEKSSAEVKAEAEPRIQALRDQMAKLTTQLDAAEDASESTWDDIKTGFTKGYDELKNGFNQARQWVSDRIAP